MPLNIPSFKIGNRLVGPDAPCLIVGEIAQAHDGSLGMAHAYIDAVARAGADAVKFQTHIASAESSPEEPFRVKFSQQDTTRYDYWKRMEFTPEQWAGLAEHAREKSLLFLSSPFSEEAIDLLNELDMPAWKVASGEVNNPLLWERILKTRLPIILSTGMSTFEEIDQSVGLIKSNQVAFAVLQCTSKYPVLPEEIGLNLIPHFRSRYSCPVGLSDHSGKLYAGLAAATLGANIIEVHVTFNREMFGPDVQASLTTAELGQLVEGVHFIEATLASTINKDQLIEDMETMRTIFGKSLVARADLKAGQRLQREHVTARKPGWGIPVSRMEEVLGKTLKIDVARGSFFKPGDFVEEVKQPYGQEA
jgi:N,N'-diacetyllegionaminate synthase